MMQAETGKWYSSALVNTQVVEFKFDHEPTQQEIDDLVAHYETLPIETVIVEAENGEEV